MMRRRNFCRAVALGTALAPALSGRALTAVYEGLMSVDRDVEALTLEGREQIIGQGTVQSLADSLRGRLLLPGNAGYEAARRVLNASIDKHPALIVQPTGAADISSAVDFARDNNLIVAVKCGGHSYGGKSTCDGGMMIDLSSFRSARVDPVTRSAHVTGGSLLGQLDHESMALGLVTTAGTVSHTGVGGLATAGGFGRLARRYGLALDNIISVDVVSADGRLRHASVEENPDLFWAVRGGGGNFGVVTNFEFRLHPMNRQVIGGGLVYPVERLRDLMTIYADYSVRCPETLYTDLVAGYPYGDKPGFALLDVCWSGDPAGYEKAMQPYRALGEPLHNGVRAVDYVALQRSGDSTDARSWASYLKGGFISEIRPELVDAAIDALDPHPGRTSMLFMQHSGGAIARVPADATAFAHRYASHNLMILSAWKAAYAGDEHLRYGRSAWKSLESFTHGFYSVEVIDGQDPAAINLNYQGNYPRLARIKKTYDPDNMFRLNANVEPA
jgi:FAD/FMN-containing dehydrogenase